jgi:UDP-glucose 4-epimerase
MDRESLENALQGIEVVIHCARGPAKGAMVEGTRRLLEAIRLGGIKRLVQMSSIAVYGNASGIITEDVPASPIDQYGEEKFAEEKLCQAAAGPDLTVAVVRPSLVYGPFGDFWTGRFIESIAAGRLKQLGKAGWGQANLIYVEDLAHFAAELAIRPLPEYSVYNANGPEIPTFDEYFDRLSRALGQGPLPVSERHAIPAGLRRQVRRAARLLLRTQQATLKKIAQGKPNLELALSAIEKTFQRDLSDEPRSRFSQRVVYSNDRARRAGLKPRTSLQEGVSASVEWAKSNGLIKKIDPDETSAGLLRSLDQSLAAQRSSKPYGR